MNNAATKPTWYILGAGAIGSLWACCWRKSGFPVVLITPTERSGNSINLIADEQRQHCDVAQLTIDQLTASNTTISHLLISTKAQDTLAATAAIAPNIAADATVLVLQNGMAAIHVPDILKTQTLITGITSDGAYRTDRQTVVFAGRGQTCFGADATLLKWLPDQLLDIRCCDDITVRQWKKLAINCAINGLTAIHQCRNGELLGNPQACHSIHKLCDELINLSTVIGQGKAVENLWAEVEKTLRETAQNFSSMYQDIAQGRKTEIEFLNGYICDLAKQHTIPCPENATIVEKVRQLEQR